MDEANWNDFFVASMGAAGALTGLVTVAISINLKRILKYKQLPGRAGEALLILVIAMLVSGIGLIPHDTLMIQGLWTTAFGAVGLIFSVRSQVVAYRIMRKPPVSWWLARAIMTLLTMVPITAGGLAQAMTMPIGIHWTAFGILAALAAGVYATWVLMIEILR